MPATLAVKIILSTRRANTDEIFTKIQSRALHENTGQNIAQNRNWYGLGAPGLPQGLKEKD